MVWSSVCEGKGVWGINESNKPANELLVSESNKLVNLSMNPTTLSIFTLIFFCDTADDLHEFEHGIRVCNGPCILLLPDSHGYVNQQANGGGDQRQKGGLAPCDNGAPPTCSCMRRDMKKCELNLALACLSCHIRHAAHPHSVLSEYPPPASHHTIATNLCRKQRKLLPALYPSSS